MTVKFEEMTEDDDDESDKHLEARDRRYSCLKIIDEVSQAFNSVKITFVGCASIYDFRQRKL